MKSTHSLSKSSANLSRRSLLKAAALAPVYIAGARLLQSCGHAETPNTASAGDMLELGAREAVERIKNGEMTTEAYVARLVQHHNAYNDLNTIITINETRLMEEARAVDQARAKGETLGPLAGLPLAVKDNINVAGYPTTLGNKALEGYVPKATAAVVRKVLGAGAIVFAKTSVPTRVGGDVPLSSPFGANRSYGTVRNPYSTTRASGGSSAGNGSAIAARIVPAGLGEDSTGSVRIPAGLCGLAGLRPTTRTTKRYSDDGFEPPPTGALKTMGPMARTVADVVFLDTVITGETPPTVNLRDVRIGIPRPDYWTWEVMDPGVAEVTQAALAKLRDAGVQLVETDVQEMVKFADSEEVSRAAGGGGGGGNMFAQWLAENLPGVTMEQVYAGYPLPDAAQPPRNSLSPEERQATLQAAYARNEEFFKSNNIQAVAFPTMPYRAPVMEPTGKLVDEKGRLILTTDYAAVRWASRMGSPGLSVPSGLISGLPVGLELDALPGDDSWLLGLGLAVERVLGRIPPPPLNRAP